jgi:hypothetical protein
MPCGRSGERPSHRVRRLGRLVCWSMMAACALSGTRLLGARATLISEDCEPKRACDATRDCSLKVDTRDCSLKVDTRDCSLKVDTRSCGHDGPFGIHYNDPFCEAAKAAQNGIYAGEKAACESAKAAQNAAYAGEKAGCESAKGAQNTAYAAEKATCEAQKATEKLDCERIKSQERLACELGLAGPYSCRAGEVAGALRQQRQAAVTSFDEWAALVSTPAKAALPGGVPGSWRSTACSASGVGRLYQEARHSQDGFWTVDVELLSFEVDGVKKPEGQRFLRLEVKPARFGGGRAHDFFDQQSVAVGEAVKFEGPVFVDNDGPFLEVHPVDVFEKVH